MNKKTKSIIKKIIVGINNGYISVVRGIAKCLKYNNFDEVLLKNMCKIYEKNSDYYVAYKIRPKTSEKIFSIERDNKYDEEVGIVIQGPLFLENHFTLETVKTYQKIFPSAKIIVSTWEGEDRSEIESLKKIKNCFVLLNKMPNDAGILNSNLQRVSTLNGIREAKRLGCKYVLKTRGDWRIYKKGTLRFMIHLLNQFPCDCVKFKQKYRIIAADIATEETSIMFYPFWITDLLMFGEIEDMEKYWNSTLTEQKGLDKKTVNYLIRKNNYSWKERITEGLHNESRIAIDYITRMTGKTPDITVKEYWDYLKNYFIIVPKSLIDAFWFKYEDRRVNESSDWGVCFTNDSLDDLLTYNFDFISWLNLYSNDFYYEEDYEKIPITRKYKLY